LRDQWHWEFVARYSGATVLESHEVPSVDNDWMANHPKLSKSNGVINFLANEAREFREKLSANEK